MHSNALDLALAAINNKRWTNSGSKLRVISVVRLNTIENPSARAGSFVVLPRDLARRTTGMSESWMHKVLDQIVADSVLEREAGAGRRGHAYRFMEPITRWRVPWSIDPELVEQRAARLLERQSEPNPGFVARHHAQLYDVVARHGAQQPGCSCALCRAASAHTSARHGAQQRLADALGHPLPEVSNSLESDPSAREGLVAELVEAIRVHTGRPTYGEPLRELRGIVARWPSDDVGPLLAAIRRLAAGGAWPPMVVAGLGGIKPGESLSIVNAAPVHPPAWERVELDGDPVAAAAFFEARRAQREHGCADRTDVR